MPKYIGTTRECLTFGDLKVGQKFICKPLPGDNTGHGGYAGIHFIQVKTEPMKYNSTHPRPPANTLVLKFGTLSHSPNGMIVIPIE